MNTKIKVDGIVGPVTLSLANSAQSNEIAHAFIQNRIKTYQSIVEQNPKQQPNLRGWLNRVENTTNWVAQL